MFDQSKSILQEIHPWFVNNTKKKLFIKRDDLIHPFVSGNKWRKLKYIISHVLQQRFEGMLTFGGAYSNHLLATASAGEKFGIPTIGIVRGEELKTTSNAMLVMCRELGMELHFISRSEYSLRNDKSYQGILNERFQGYYQIPEGGSNYLGLIGCQEIMRECEFDFDHVFVAQGTTTTSCGILSCLSPKSKLHVIPALKGFHAINEMKELMSHSAFDGDWIDDLLEQVIVHSDFHFGGYGKYTNELLNFLERFYAETKVPLDPIYTGKAMFAVMDYYMSSPDQEENILFIHTGGLQGGEMIIEKEKKLFC
jgi:1-aminocyclopropane-1-carboxylate deaminase